MHALKDTYGYGLIGCGRFGRFCLEALQALPAVRPVAVADADAKAAESLAAEAGLAACGSADELLGRADIDLVHVATPPQTHHPLALAGLRAGKHVLCEKPLALTVAEADELLAVARQTGRVLAVNHVLRYSRLPEVVREILRQGLLGRPLHAFFENYAEDERLPADHWFWDAGRSGGIFVEHGVHFFDLHRWWFGPGRVTSAGTEVRPGTGQVDRVFCTARHDSGVVACCYHGFDQPVRLDRADHRIVCERGDIQVFGWIPIELGLCAIVDDETADALAALCHPAETHTIESYTGDEKVCRGRGNDYCVTRKVTLIGRLQGRKGDIYAEMFRRLVADQLAAAESPEHRPRLTADDARDALAMAAEARAIAASHTSP